MGRSRMSAGCPGGSRSWTKITQEVRDYAAKHGIPESQAIQTGMAHKAEEFKQSGGQIYTSA